MADQTQKRRKKVTGEAEHRTGTLRAAVRPGATVGTKGVSTIIQEFVAAKGAKAFSQSVWGSALAASAAALRSAFELPATEELYLFSGRQSGTQTAGILLSGSGFHLLDGKGGFANVNWGQFANCDISVRSGMLVIGQMGISSPDSQVLGELLQAIKASLS